MGGATIQWLRNGLKIIKQASQVSELASRFGDTGGVYLVPAFAGGNSVSNEGRTGVYKTLDMS